MGDGEIDDLKLYLAANPEAGVIIPGTGGIRKLRWAASGRGKRGGGRVVYYYHDLRMPLALIAFFTKNQKSDLSEKEKVTAKKVVKELIEHYRAKRG